MLAKIGRENRFPRDPHMLGLLSWKQEQVEGALYCTVLYCTVLYCTVLYTVQVEGVAIVTMVVENILKELDIDQTKVALLKVNTN